MSDRPFADLTDVTLADEDINSILTDNANRAIQGNVAMQVTQPGGQLWNQTMEVMSPDYKISNPFEISQKMHIQMKYKSDFKTLPEAQRAQGIDSIS